MKRITHLFLMTLGLVLSAIPMYSWGQGSDNPNVVLMPQFGMPEDGAVIVSDEITFYDHWGEENICPNINMALERAKEIIWGKYSSRICTTVSG